MAVLRGLVDKAEQVVNTAVGEQIEAQRERIRGQAEQHDQWRDLAPHLATWEDDDGDAAFGVPDEADEDGRAEMLEYGTDTQPPVPLIRMGVLSQVSDIGWSLTDRFRAEGF
jgi:hypothetical protein